MNSQNRNSGVAGNDDQAKINQLLFELVISLMNRLNELIPRVEALRLLQQVGGPEPVPVEEFEKIAAKVKESFGPEANAELERVQQLVAALKLPQQ